MGRKDGNSTSGGGAFRNPHNLPVKECVVCKRPFTWRKKWEKCWDEVLTCSQRCKSERRSKSHVVATSTTAVAATAALKGTRGQKLVKTDDVSEDDSCEEPEGIMDTPLTAKQKITSDLENHASGRDPLLRPLQTCTVPTAEHAGEEMFDKRLLELLMENGDSELLSSQIPLSPEEMHGLEDDDNEAYRAQDPLRPEDMRSARKQAAKAMKAQRRAHRTGSTEASIAKQKPCDECTRHVDLLIRCTSNESQQWQMLCGRCWGKASGGVPDGDADHPHYRYGGLWKNRAAAIKYPNFGVD